MRIDSSGNVGIGTSSPTEVLHVVGDILATGGDFKSDANNYLGFSNDTFARFVINDSEKMRINSNGNIGIGTSNSTTAKVYINHEGDVDDNGLYVYSNIGQTVPLVRVIQDGAGSTAPAVYIRNDDADGIALHLYKGSSGVTPNSYANTLFIESSSNTGLTIASGTSSYSSIYFANSTDIDIARIEVVHSDNSMRFTNNAAERMRIDSSGSVGIGNTTMSSFNSEANNLVVGTGSGDEGITIYTGSSAGHHGSIFFADGTDVNAQKRGQIRYEHNNEIMSFFTNTLERMRINQNGNIQIGTTTESARLHIASSTTAGTDPLVVFSDASGTDCGSIDLNATANTVAYTTSSDYRLKENVSYDFDATTRLKQLRPARFNFKTDADTTVDGFIAHEVQSVVPEAITGTHNEVKVWKEGEELPEGVSVGDNKLDENGNTIPVYQGIDQSKLVPLLVKTIQELEARITALETNQP
jgi:hypothetical protein